MNNEANELRYHDEPKLNVWLARHFGSKRREHYMPEISRQMETKKWMGKEYIISKGHLFVSTLGD